MRVVDEVAVVDNEGHCTVDGPCNLNAEGFKNMIKFHGSVPLLSTLVEKKDKSESL